MFSIGDEVFVKNSDGLRGIVFNKVNGIKRNDYLVKTEIFEKWYHEHEIELASTISETVPKFKDGDRVFLTEEHDLKNGKVIPKDTKGVIERTGEVIGTKLFFYLVNINDKVEMLTENELELDKETTQIKPKFKVGDEVSYGEMNHQKGEIIKIIKKENETFYSIDAIIGATMVAHEDCIELTPEAKLKKAIQDAPIESAPTDYSIKSDKNKPQLSLVPIQPIWEAIAQVREYGVSKYGDNDSWKKVEIKRYHDALLRHTAAIVQDLNSVDEESRLPHRWHIACNLAFIEALMEDK